MNDKQLGKILLKFNLIPEAQLERCFEILKDLDPPTSLAKLLVRRGLVDEKTLSAVSRMDIDVEADEPEEHEATEAELTARLQKDGATGYLSVARELGASDVYLTSDHEPLIRLHGNLVALSPTPLSSEACRELLFSLLSEDQIASLERRRHLDVSIPVSGSGRFRGNIFRHSGGIAGVFRVIAEQVRPFDELNLPPVVREFVDFTQGLVLVTGPTGSGKSTTLASLIDIVNDTYKLHVVSLEDPIEAIHTSKRSLITQREIFSHSDSFATGLRAALREDPDIIVVGEMRDSETVATALTAAETGHLVFGTLHTREAHSTILRIVDQFPLHKRAHVRTILAGVLRAVVCQELVPNARGDGRVLASEVMIVNAAISNLIREDRTWQIPSVMQMSKGGGMQLMDDCLDELVRSGQITAEAARSRASEKERFAATPPAPPGRRKATSATRH